MSDSTWGGPGGQPPSGASGGSPGSEPGLPWENRQQLGFGNAIVQTVKGVLLEPNATFRAMKRKGGLGDPLGYGVLLGTLGGIAGLVWQMLFSTLGPLLQGGSHLQDMMGGAISMVVFLVMMPAFVVLGLFIWAGVVHLFALMFGAGQHGFETTFRVVCFANGSTAVLQAIPIFGGFAAAIWLVVAAIIGLKEAQQTTTGKAVAAVLVPVVLCCGCVAMAMGLVVFMAARARN